MTPRRTMAANDRARRVAMIIRRCRTLTAVRVVQYLADLEGRHDKVSPSREGIARAIGRCERSVSRAVGELEAAGALAVWRDRPHCRKSGGWTRGRTNMYRLTWPPKTAKAQVAPKGHALHAKAILKAIEPNGGAHLAAPTPLGVPELTLFPDETEPIPPPAEPPAPPPWVTEGVDRNEWIRRCRS